MGRALLTLVTALAMASRAGAQEPAPPPEGTAFLEDFGLDDVDEVRRGRISLVHDPAGLRLDVRFLRDTAAAAAAVPSVPPPEALAGGGDTNPEIDALWVWSTEELLRGRTQRDTFLSFVERRGIDRVFLYVPAAQGEEPRAGFVPFDGDALAPLLRALHQLGVLTYALDGDPDYVRPENREGVLRTVRRVAEHNRTRPPEERFYGVRYDVEPYLVRGFQGPRRRQILDGYVRLLADVAVVAHEGGLAVGADVPFWFDATDEETGEPFEAVLDGARRPVLEHVMRLVDDVAIMAYRTRADGPDGVVTQSAAEVLLGAHTPTTAHVFVGVETAPLLDEELYTFQGPGRVGVPTLDDAPWVVLEDRGGGSLRVWLAEGREALDTLARQVPDPERLRYWFAGAPSPIPAERLSFHSLGPDALAAVTQRVVSRFESQPGFLGVAYHDYQGLRELLEGNGP